MNPIFLLFIPVILTCFVIVACILSSKNISNNNKSNKLIEKKEVKPGINPDINLNKM